MRSEILTTKRTIAGVEEAFPTWKLMMKNIYALGASPLTPDGFRFEIQYRDDQTGVSSNTLQNAQSTDICLLYTSPSPRDRTRSRMPSSA